MIKCIFSFKKMGEVFLYFSDIALYAVGFDAQHKIGERQDGRSKQRYTVRYKLSVLHALPPILFKDRNFN